MADYRPPLDDIAFVVNHLCRLGSLAEYAAYEHADPDTVGGVLEESGRFMADVIGPLNRNSDEQGSVWAEGEVITPDGFKDAYAQYVAAGWGAVPFEPEYGGGGFPWLVSVATQEMLSSACMSFSMAPLLTQGAIDMLSHHGDADQKLTYLPKMLTGEWAGTMNLTEPQAGSDVGALTTRAEPADDGTYRITGTKIFISFGEHDMAENIIHLVLARTPDAPPGTKGISCFIVPKFLLADDGTPGERNDVTCVSIEHKMGIKASPTCVLSYGEGAFGDEGEGAVGYLIGNLNEGMRYMFTMMNNARLSVGLEGLALAERAYQDALEYAQERLQGRGLDGEPGQQAAIIEHPDVRRMLLTMKALIEAMRGLMYLNAEALDRSRHDPDTDAREQAAELADLLTPLSKGWGTDMGCEVTSLAVQVFGGMGYIEESGVAQHFRDARITPIYEGTNGIQGMDLVGRKLPMRGGGVVTDHLDDMAALAEELAAGDGDLAVVGSRLAAAVDDARTATAWLMEHGLADPADALAGATPYLRLLSTATGGWVLAREAQLAAAQLADGEGDTGFLEAKITTARFFADNLLPATAGLVPAVTAGSETLYAVTPSQL